jgi:23S rRNA-/tRNA-specific pseudouridylate synthase
VEVRRHRPTASTPVTHYETIEAFPFASLLEVHLETGRTHQIRVHMAAQRHPCAGDAMYGADPTLSARLGLTRQWLHAKELSLTHPGTGTGPRSSRSTRPTSRTRSTCCAATERPRRHPRRAPARPTWVGRRRL